jgi:uncharacterized membrane protein
VVHNSLIALTGIIFLLFFVALCYRNADRARKRGLNGLTYGAFTGFMLLVGMFVGIVVEILLFFQDLFVVQPQSANDPKYKQLVTDRLSDAFSRNPLHELTIQLFALGGYLLVRYIIEQKRATPIPPADTSA